MNKTMRIFSHNLMTPKMYKATVFKEQQVHFHGCSKERQASLDNGGEFGGQLTEGLAEAAMQSWGLGFFLR